MRKKAEVEATASSLALGFLLLHVIDKAHVQGYREKVLALRSGQTHPLGRKDSSRCLSSKWGFIRTSGARRLCKSSKSRANRIALRDLTLCNYKGDRGFWSSMKTCFRGPALKLQNTRESMWK